MAYLCDTWKPRWRIPTRSWSEILLKPFLLMLLLLLFFPDFFHNCSKKKTEEKESNKQFKVHSSKLVICCCFSNFFHAFDFATILLVFIIVKLVLWWRHWRSLNGTFVAEGFFLLSSNTSANSQATALTNSLIPILPFVLKNRNIFKQNWLK